MSYKDNPSFRYLPACLCDDCEEFKRDHAMPPVDLHLGDTIAQEKPILRGYTSAERKEIPMQEVLAEYFPDAFAAVSRHSKKANDKHNPGEPMHWARNKSTDHLNCAVRHLATPDAIDPDTGEIELVGATWRCLAALQLREEKRLIAAGIRPLSGVTE